MIRKQRQQMILEFLKTKQIYAMEDLSNELNIPMTTLRRDLHDLEKDGSINKLHGGVEYNNHSSIVLEDFFETKVADHIEEKEQLAKQAIKLIKPNETIYIDSGSSGYYLAKYLPVSLDLSIVTNSIYNVLELVKQGHENVYLLGGKFRNVTGAIIGFEAIEALQNYCFDKAFLGINAIDKHENLYTTNSDHAQIKIAIINQTEQTYGLADSSKYNRKAFYKFANEKQVKLIKLK